MPYNNHTSQDHPIAAERKQICHRCMYYKMLRDMCMVCNCKIEEKAHSSVETCPKRKWIR